MSYKVRRRGSKYEVVNAETGDGYGATTKAKANHQLRVLRGLERGWKSTGDGCYTRTINGKRVKLRVTGGKSSGETK